MSGAILPRRLLRGVNGLLGAGILAYCVRVPLRANEFHLDLPPDGEPPRILLRVRDEGDGVLKTLINPLGRRAGKPAVPAGPSFRAVLKGTLAGERESGRSVAFLRSLERNAELVAYLGEEILRDGKPDEELRGWRLWSVGKETAVFVNGTGERIELSIDPSSAPATGGSGPAAASRGALPAGKPYAAESYRSRLLASADNRQIWGIDPDEIDWAAQHVPEILDRDVQVAPYAGGGLRLEGVLPGSIGAARGLLAGDVLREVNGRPLSSAAELRALLDNPASATQSGLRLTIERAGKPLVFEYRPLPR